MNNINGHYVRHFEQLNHDLLMQELEFDFFKYDRNQSVINIYSGLDIILKMTFYFIAKVLVTGLRCCLA